MRAIAALAGAVAIVVASAATAKQAAWLGGNPCDTEPKLRLVSTLTLTFPGGRAMYAFAPDKTYYLVFRGVLSEGSGGGGVRAVPVGRATMLVNGARTGLFRDGLNHNAAEAKGWVWMRTTGGGQSIQWMRAGSLVQPTSPPWSCDQLLPAGQPAPFTLPGGKLDVAPDPGATPYTGSITIEIYDYVRTAGPPPPPTPGDRYVWSFWGTDPVPGKSARPEDEQRRWLSVSGQGTLSLRGSAVEATGFGTIGGIYVRGGTRGGIIRSASFRIRSGQRQADDSLRLTGEVIASTFDSCPRTGESLTFLVSTNELFVLGGCAIYGGRAQARVTRVGR